MTTLDFTATTDPKDLVAELSLTTGQRYALQNLDDEAVLFMRESPSIPADTAPGFKVEPGDTAVLLVDGAVWAWCDSGSCAVVVGLAP